MKKIALFIALFIATTIPLIYIYISGKNSVESNKNQYFLLGSVYDLLSRYKLESCPKYKGSLSEDERLLLKVDRTIGLSKNYTPTDLTDVSASKLVDVSGKVKTFGVSCLEQQVVPSLVALFSEAKKRGYALAITSAFRSYQLQATLYNFWQRKEPETYFDEVALPGHSEHQLGLTIDLTSEYLGWKAVAPELGISPEGKWLAENSYKFGFVMSYPKDKKDITGYSYEPWHFRYVGTAAAREIFDRQITLNEYLYQLENKPAGSIAIGATDNFHYKWKRDLFYGLKKDMDAKALQQALSLQGVYQREIDGNFEEKTREAVISFQKKYNFTAVPDTGYVGPYTRKVLNALYK